MIPDKCFNYNKPLVKALSLVGIGLWRWDPKSRRFYMAKKKSTYNIFKEVTIWHILTRCLALAYILFTCAVMDIPAYQVISAGCVVVLLICSTSVLILARDPNIQRIILGFLNGFLVFNDVQMRIHKIRQKHVKNRAFDNFVRSAALIMVFLCIAIGPCTYLLLDQHWELLWIVNIFSVIPGLFAFISALLPLYVLIDFLLILYIILAAYTYCNITSAWMSKNICVGQKTPEYLKEKLRILYRAHIIFFKYLDASVQPFIPTTLLLGTTLQILSLYSFVRLFDVMSAALIGTGAVFLVTVTIYMYLAFRMPSKLTNLSAEYPNSFKRLDKYYSKVDRKFFASVKPLEFHIGRYCKVNDCLFIAIENFVINWLMNLLIYFPKEGLNDELNA